MSGTTFQSGSEPNTLQIQPNGNNRLTVVADGDWSRTRPSVDSLMQRVGGSGLETVGKITAHSGQNGFFTSGYSGFSVDIILDDQVLRANKFSAVRALLDGVTQDLHLTGVRAAFSEASIYQQVIAVTRLQPQDYEAAFGFDQSEINKRIDQNGARIRRGDIDVAVGFLPASGEPRIYTGDEATKASARAKYSSLDTSAPQQTIEVARKQANDGGVVVTHTKKGAYVSVGSGYGVGGDMQAEMYDIQQSEKFKKTALANNLNVLDNADREIPAMNLRNGVTVKLTSHRQAEMLADLLTTKGLSEEKLDEVRNAIPPSGFDRLVAKFSFGAHPKSAPA